MARKHRAASVVREPRLGDYLGPIGANGSRPLLGRRGDDRAAGCPTARVPAASVAARAEEAARNQSASRGDEPTGTPPADADGFQQVAGRGRATWAARAAAAAAAPTNDGATKTSNSWAALDDDDDDGPGGDDVRMGDGGMADAAGGDVHGEEEARPNDAGDGRDDEQGQAEGESLGEGELRQRWQAHAHACMLMERDPQAFPPPLLAAAKAQRDEAERRWRAAKTPHPLHKRLRWAQAELQEAENKEASHRRDLQEHLQSVARRTQELQDRLATSSARTARRRAALEAIRLEAAPGERTAADKAARVAATGITMDVAPQLEAAIERLATPLGEDA
jgi:hypothetical protein